MTKEGIASGDEAGPGAGTAVKGLAILGAVAWIYAPAFRGGWVWDDLAEVPHNPALADPWGWAKAWFAAAGADYFPLKVDVQWVAWHLWGERPPGYHLLNAALHAAAALLLWRVLRQLGMRWAFWAGAAFAVHPMAVESVAWISELKNTLSLPLMLLSFGAYVEFDRRYDGGAVRDRGSAGPWVPYAAAVGWFAAAVLAKASVVVLPLLLVIYVLWRRRGCRGRDLYPTAPFFIIAAALGAVTVWFQEHRALAPGALELGGWASRVATAGLAIVFYAAKCALPQGLCPVYPRWNVEPPSWEQFLPWVGLGLVCWALWTARRRPGWESGCRTALFVIGGFVASLLPVLGFIPLSYERLSWVADHLGYIALAVGVSGLVLALEAVARTVTRAAPAARLGAGIVGAGVLGALAYASHGYAAVFRGDESVWRYTLARNPRCWLAENDLGQDEERAGNYEAALGHFRRALAIDPRLADAEVNLGDTLLQLGRAPEAEAAYRRALGIKPGYPPAREYLAEALYREGNAVGNAGNVAGAMARYAEALEQWPAHVEARANLGLALAESGRATEAIAQLTLALREKPGAADVEEYLGYALARAGRWTEALARYDAALGADAANPDLHYNRAEALRALGRIGEAAAEERTAQELSVGR